MDYNKNKEVIFMEKELSNKVECEHEGCDCHDHKTNDAVIDKEVDIVLDEDRLHMVGRSVTEDNWEEAYECRQKMLLYMSRNENAIGVAAQQVGYDLKMFLMRFKDELILALNPSVIKIKPTKYTYKSKEQCLSKPGETYLVNRCQIIKGCFTDEKMKKHEQRFKDIWAAVFQHECDHCNGILISDKGKKISEKCEFSL
jgi:peptide deformylase